MKLCVNVVYLGMFHCVSARWAATQLSSAAIRLEDNFNYRILCFQIICGLGGLNRWLRSPYIFCKSISWIKSMRKHLLFFFDDFDTTVECVDTVECGWLVGWGWKAPAEWWPFPNLPTYSTFADKTYEMNFYSLSNIAAIIRFFDRLICVACVEQILMQF